MPTCKLFCVLLQKLCLLNRVQLAIRTEGWFPLGVDCRRSAKNSLFIYLVFARIKLNRETKNFKRYPCNLRLMETSL